MPSLKACSLLELATSGSGSELFTGGTNPNLYSGSIEYHPVVSDCYWTVGGGSVRVDGHTISSGLKMIIDSGTTLLVAEPSVVRSFYANIRESGYNENSGYYTFPCNATPKTAFSWGAKIWEIDPQ